MSATEVDSGFEAGSEPQLCNFKGSKIESAQMTTDGRPERIPQPDVFEGQRVKLLNHKQQPQQQQQQQQQGAKPQLNRHECGSNQSGIDSGLGHTSSISSENSSVIANTTSLEQVNARNNSTSVNSRAICVSSDGRQLAGAKSVKVFEVTNTKSDQDKSPLSSQPPLSSTKNELADRGTSNNPERESSSNITQVISNSDDEAKIKQAQLGERGSNQMASPSGGRNGANHEICDPLTRPSGALHQAAGSLATDPIVDSNPNTPPLIKSSLKKAVGKSIGVPKKTKHNRNVSFNQTVIVFCEEIEASSPSDTFEPPLDYRDSFHGDDAENLPIKLAESSAKDLQQQDLYNDDDFDILSRIVCDDASSLTDDQLIGLLENGSLLRNDAISDSESESSLTTDIRLRDEPPIISKRAAQISTKSKEPPSKAAKTRESAGCPDITRKELRNSMNSTNSLPVDHYSETSAYAAPANQQKSMPARVKVSTVDSHHRNQSRQGVAQADEIDSSSQGRNVCKPAQSGNLNSAKCDVLPIKLTNAESVTSSISQIWESPSADETVKRSAKLEHGKDCPQDAVAKTSSNSRSFVPSDDQISSMEKRSDGIDQHNQRVAGHSPNQPINVANAQVIQTNQGCHICRAIESNINNQTKINPRGERTSLITNINSLQLNAGAPDQHHSQKAAPTQYHNSGAVVVEPKQLQQLQLQQQKRAQLLPSNQPSCVSCHELTARQRQIQQNHVTQLVRPNLTGRVDQQPTRPIACQLVYVVDHQGNRMRALQVVNPAQVELPNAQVRPLLIAHENCRQQVPSTNHNVYCAPKSCDQMMGATRAGPPLIAAQPGAPNRFVAPPSMNSGSPAMQQGMLLNHSGPRNHTVYYVRQPLGSQNSQHSSGSLTRPMTKSFPDAHEVRRLDGIRAPTESPGLKQTEIQPDKPPTSGSEGRPQYSIENKTPRLRKDESEDPSFGFSQRPAVKVVANTMRESQSQSINLSSGSNSIGPPISKSGSLIGSHTMDRRSANRESRPTVSASCQGNFI